MKTQEEEIEQLNQMLEVVFSAIDSNNRNGNVDVNDLAKFCVFGDVAMQMDQTLVSDCAYWTMQMSFKYGNLITLDNMQDYLEKALNDGDKMKIDIIEGSLVLIELVTMVYGAYSMFFKMDQNVSGNLSRSELESEDYDFLLTDGSDFDNNRNIDLYELINYFLKTNETSFYKKKRLLQKCADEIRQRGGL